MSASLPWRQRWSAAWPVLLLLVLAVLGRALFVAAYADPLPYWDQWDSEGAYLIKPWLEGSLPASRFLEPHNEHRIAFTRLLTLALFELNGGQWDNLVSALANTLLAAVNAALLYALLAPGLGSPTARRLWWLALLALAWLPFGWENSLVGFQSQFFVLIFMAVATLALASRVAPGPRGGATIVVVALLGLFTMATGVLAPVAAGALLVLRAWLGEWRWPSALAIVAVLAVLAIGGFLAVPVLAGHQGLKAADAGEFLQAFGHTLGWPLRGSYAGALLLWLPSLLFAWRLLRTRRASPDEFLAAGLAFWALLQCAAIAYSRGHGLASPSSRYTDLLAIGLLANAWFALRSLPAGAPSAALRQALPALALLLASGGAAAWGLWQGLPADLASARGRAALSTLQTAHVSAYLRDGDIGRLQVPFHHIPYPDAGRLAMLLSDPALRSALPWTVRPPLEQGVGRAEGDVRLLRTPAAGWTCGEVAGDCAAGQGRYVGPLQRARQGQVFVPQARAGAGKGLRLATATAGTPGPQSPRWGWDDSFHSVDRAGFRLMADDADPASWLAWGAPVEIGPLSRWAARLQAVAWRRFPHSDRGESRGTRLQWPAAGEGEPRPWSLSAKAQVRASLRAPASGLLLRVGVPLGTYGKSPSGTLWLELCVDTVCAVAESALAGAVDNQELMLSLDRPVPVQAGQLIGVRTRRRGPDSPLVVWLAPAPTPARTGPLALQAADGARERDAAHTLRLVLVYLR